MKLTKGDQIIVTAGKDKGRKGKVGRVFPKENTVLVPGINMYKRHMKRRDEKHPGGIIDIPRPITVANITLLCPHCGKPTRVGYLLMKDEKVKICKKCNQKI
jgi:large subunit ribosomal protein L24